MKMSRFTEDQMYASCARRERLPQTRRADGDEVLLDHRRDGGKERGYVAALHPTARPGGRRLAGPSRKTDYPG